MVPVHWNSLIARCCTVITLPWVQCWSLHVYTKVILNPAASCAWEQWERSVLGLSASLSSSLIKNTHKYIKGFRVSVVSSSHQQNLKCSFAFLLSSTPGFLWKRDLSVSLIWPRSCAVWDLCKEPHICHSVPQTEHFDFPSPSVRHCKASWTPGVVMGREKSRMDVGVNPAGRSRQLRVSSCHILSLYS